MFKNRRLSSLCFHSSLQNLSAPAVRTNCWWTMPGNPSAFQFFLVHDISAVCFIFLLITHSYRIWKHELSNNARKASNIKLPLYNELWIITYLAIIFNIIGPLINVTVGTTAPIGIAMNKQYNYCTGWIIWLYD